MTWILRERIATWDAGQWNVSVDLNTDPRLAIRRGGLEHFAAAINPQDGDEVPSETSLVLADSYVRNRDLVAAYPEQAPLRFGYQTYFSVLDTPSDVLALECWLSVQTSTLEAYPQLVLGLVANGASFHAESPSGVFLSSDKKIAFIVHPLDAGDAAITTPELHAQSLAVFGRFMEKGVIRRLRARILVSSTAMQDEQWLQAQKDFANSPLPLTT